MVRRGRFPVGARRFLTSLHPSDCSTNIANFRLLEGTSPADGVEEAFDRIAWTVMSFLALADSPISQRERRRNAV